MADVGPTNCEEPHTVELPHIAELFHTDEGSNPRNTLPELES